MSYNPNFANREVAKLKIFDYATKKPYLNFDLANVTTTNLSATRVFATGGQGAPDLVGFDGQRKGTLKIEAQVTPMKMYSMIAGNEIETSTTYCKREVLTSTDKAITLTETPTGAVYVYKVDDDCGTEIANTVATKTVTLTGESVVDGTFIVYYFVTVASGAQKITFKASKFPKAFVIYGETPWKTTDDTILTMYLKYYKAHPQAALDLAFQSTGDPSKISIVCDLEADPDGNIYDMSFVEPVAE